MKIYSAFLGLLVLPYMLAGQKSFGVDDVVYLPPANFKYKLFEQQGRSTTADGEVPGITYNYTRRLWYMPATEMETLSLPAPTDLVNASVKDAVTLITVDEIDTPKPGFWLIEVEAHAGDKTDTHTERYSLIFPLDVTGHYRRARLGPDQSGEETPIKETVDVDGEAFLYVKQNKQPSHYFAFIERFIEEANQSSEIGLSRWLQRGLLSVISAPLLGETATSPQDEQDRSVTLDRSASTMLGLNTQQLNQRYDGFYIDKQRNLVLVGSHHNYHLKLVLPE